MGDLVLLYTLKKNKWKLKKRGLGPYVINELLSSGVVRLQTLDGEPMATFISTCWLKRYHETLIGDMLGGMHTTKTHKEVIQQLKEDAQA